MSAYGKVTYSSTDDMAVESITQDIQSESVVEKQVEKFDTTYSSDKLQELYAEYDRITIDEEKIKSLTQMKTNAVSTAIPFRLMLGVTTIVSVLLVFLCIYNIFVINNMSVGIDYLQGEVISYQESLVQSEGVYNQLIKLYGINV